MKQSYVCIKQEKELNTCVLEYIRMMLQEYYSQDIVEKLSTTLCEHSMFGLRKNEYERNS